MQGVKRKGRASLGLTTGVGSIYSVTSPSNGEAKPNFEFIGEDKDRQLESLWRETRIGDVLPWEDVADEAQRLLALDIHKASGNAPNEDHEDGEQENDQK